MTKREIHFIEDQIKYIKHELRMAKLFLKENGHRKIDYAHIDGFRVGIEYALDLASKILKKSK